MENYGEYAREYFGSTNAKVCDPTEITDVTTEQLSEYQLKTDGTIPGNIEYCGSTLLLKSRTSFRFYFDGELTDFTVKDNYNNDVEYKSVKTTDMFYIEIPDIPAEELDKTYTVTVGDYSVTAGALTYVYNTLNKYAESSDNTDLCNVIKALYKYIEAAKGYYGVLE